MDPLAPSPTTTPTHDPELDPPPTGRPSSGWEQPPHFPQEYQRLVANPFLAVVGLIAWFALVRQAFGARSLILLGLSLLGAVGLAGLPQYHCLDCGATGHLFRWRRHACARVLARQRTNNVRRFRGPNPMFQMVLWLYALVAVAILAAVVILSFEG